MTHTPEKPHKRRWTPERRAEAAERMRKRHADPAFAAATAERMRVRNADPEFKAKKAQRMKSLNADPVFSADRDKRSSEKFKKLHSDPAFKERMKQARMKQWSDPDRVEAASDRMRQMWVSGVLVDARRKRRSEQREKVKTPSQEIQDFRNQSIAQDRKRGMTLQKIGEKHGLSGERVRQVLKTTQARSRPDVPSDDPDPTSPTLPR